MNTRKVNTFTAVLMAGGESRRMGEDKAALELGGKLLWERQWATLRELSVERIVVSGRFGGVYCVPGVEVWEDEWPQQGPLGALATVLARMATPLAVVLAVDVPLVTGEFLAESLHLANETTGVVPWDGAYFHPLAAVYPKAAAPLARVRVERGERAVQPWVAELEAREMIRRRVLSAAEAELMANLNTPEDLARARRSLVDQRHG